MKRIFILFSLITKQYLKNPVFPALILLLPLSALLLSHSGIAEETANLHIGIYAPKKEPLTESIFSTLKQSAGIAHFIQYDDEEQMTLDILNDEIECGYVFQPGLAQKLLTGKYAGAISLLCGNQSEIAVALGNEIIFSVLLRCHNADLISHFIANNSLLSPYAAGLPGNIPETLRLYETNGSTYHVEFCVLGDDNTIENTTAMSKTPLLFPLRGTLYILVFAAGLFGSLSFLHERTTGLFCAMPHYCSFLARFLYPLSISLITGIMTVVTLSLSGVCTFSLMPCMEMLLYVIVVTMYCGLLTFLLPSPMLFAGGIPIFLIVSFVACPVFINLKPFVPGIDVLRHLLPPGYFL